MQLVNVLIYRWVRNGWMQVAEEMMRFLNEISRSIRIQGVDHLLEAHREPVRLLLHLLANLVATEADECVLLVRDGSISLGWSGNVWWENGRKGFEMV